MEEDHGGAHETLVTFEQLHHVERVRVQLLGDLSLFGLTDTLRTRNQGTTYHLPVKVNFAILR